MEAAKKPLDEIKSFFGGNPFSTPVGHKIEQATDGSLASENWALNMEICDMISVSDDAAKDAIRALKKRIQQNSGKNYSIIMYSLTVLETCVKNCGKNFHVLVCQKDFIQDLVKLIGPKNDPPVVVQEKILGLIQTWADTFEGQPELSGVVQVYQDLKSKGIEFPMTDLDSMAPILTPKRSVESEPILHQVDLGERQVKVGPEQTVKIRKDLDIVQGNMAVFAEILGEMKPGQENPQDLELMEELYTTCKEMQKRITDLLCTISCDELTAELLHINDELNNLFLRYGRCRKNQEKTTGLTSPSTQTAPTSRGDEPSLIDFGSDGAGAGAGGAVTSKLSGLSVRSSALPTAATGAIPKTTTTSYGAGAAKKPDDDFDSFAQSRKTTSGITSTTGGARAKDVVEDDDMIKMHRQSDFDEMEAWLRENPQPGGGGAGAGGGGTETSLTSSEFDKFLAERAAAGSDPKSGGDKDKKS